MKNAVYAAVTDIFIDPDDLIALIHMAAKIKGFDLHSRAFKSVITTGYNPAEKARYAELMLSGY
jgi:hypothetical protein